MPGTTTVQSFPYPFLTEAATYASLQNLANQADGKLTSMDATRALALKKDTAQARRASGTQTLSINTATVMTFNQEDWDTNALYAPGTPDRLTVVRTGLYLIWGSLLTAVAPSTLTVLEVGLRVSGTPVILQKETHTNTQPADNRQISAVGMYRVTASQTIQLHGYWTGSAGTTLDFSVAVLGCRLVAI